MCTHVSIIKREKRKEKGARRFKAAHQQYRAVGRSENLRIPVLFGGHNLPPLVEIGLTDLPKSGGAMVPPAPPGTTGLPFALLFNPCFRKDFFFMFLSKYFSLYCKLRQKGGDSPKIFSKEAVELLGAKDFMKSQSLLLLHF